MGKKIPMWVRTALHVAVVPVLVVVLALTVTVLTRLWRHPQLDCRHNLLCIGFGIFYTELGRGEDIDDVYSESGSRFLLQLARKLDEGDLQVLVCRMDDRYADLLNSSDRSDRLRRLFKEDWRTAPCSYRGPDEELLSQLRDNPNPEIPVIIACGMNGTDGQQPFHREGVVCLWSNSDVSLVKWEDMEGYRWYSPVVPVGPDSPDLRFRHLVP